MHRMGWRPDLVEWPRRPEWHFLLRYQSVAGGFPAAAPSEGNVYLGRCGRLVSRHDAPWGYSFDILGKLVRYASEDSTVWSRRKRASQQSYRRIGLRRRNHVRR